jgi:hypothetical protein
MQSDQLVIGRAYFMCGYYFRNKPIPAIETWIYVGPEAADENSSIVHRFQDPATYYASDSADVAPEGEKAELPEIQQVRVSEEDIGLVSTIEELEEFVTTVRSEPQADEVF